MSVNAPTEKRRYERVSMYLPLNYRIKTPAYVHDGPVINASEGGLLIYSTKSMSVGIKLRIELLFPKGFEVNNFEAEVEIARREDGSEDETFQYGIQLIQMNYESQMKLKQLLSGRLQKEIGKEVRSGFVNFEMRRHPRCSVDLPVECYRVNSPVSHTGRAINASEGGLMLYLPEKFEIGQQLKLVISVGTASDLDTLDMTVQVVWIDIGFLMATEEYRLGVTIVDISPTDRLKLKNLLRGISE